MKLAFQIWRGLSQKWCSLCAGYDLGKQWLDLNTFDVMGSGYIGARK
jgi:hypothetical protein